MSVTPLAEVISAKEQAACPPDAVLLGAIAAATGNARVATGVVRVGNADGAGDGASPPVKVRSGAVVGAS